MYFKSIEIREESKNETHKKKAIKFAKKKKENIHQMKIDLLITR